MVRPFPSNPIEDWEMGEGKKNGIGLGIDGPDHRNPETPGLVSGGLRKFQRCP